MIKKRSYRRLLVLTLIILIVVALLSLVFKSKKRTVERIGLPQPIEIASIASNEEPTVNTVEPARTLSSIKPAENETLLEPNFADLHQLEAFDLYKKYIDSANQGNADAQYIISKAILRCNAYIPVEKNEEIGSRAEMINIQQQGRGDTYRNIMLNIQYKCYPLINILGTSGVGNIVKLQAEWLKKAAEQGHVFADLELNHTQKTLRTAKDRQEIKVEYLSKIEIAFQRANQNDHFLWSMSRHITKYVNGYLVEDLKKGNGKQFKSTGLLGWDFVTCEASHRCDPVLKEQDLLDEGYSQNAINKALAKAKDLNEAIYMQDWPALNLE